MRTGWMAAMLALAVGGGAAAWGSAPARAEAQCRTQCRADEARDPYGCCVRTTPRRIRRRGPQPLHPESLVGDTSAVIAADTATELFRAARVWLAEARSIDTRDHRRAVPVFRRAVGAALIFLSLHPDDRRAGRMRAVLVFGMDDAGMTEMAEREVEALGGPRPTPASPEERSLRETWMLNLAWAHQQMGQRMEGARRPERRQRAVARFRRASDFYRLYVEQFPESALTPGARSELANTLISQGRYLEAATELQALARATPTRRTPALRRVVGAYQSALQEELERGLVVLRSSPPAPSMRPPWAPPVQMPPALLRLVEARDAYVVSARVDERSGVPQPPDEIALRRSWQLENARMLYVYAHWDAAHPRLTTLIEERCDDLSASRAFALLTQIRDVGGEDACSSRATAVVAPPIDG